MPYVLSWKDEDTVIFALRVSGVNSKSCLEEYGPWTSGIGITWKLVRNAESHVPRHTESESVF